MPTRKKVPQQIESSPVLVADRSTTDGPLVFISHDSRDADLAEAFANLLSDASGGVLKSFRSSDRKGNTGIAYGLEWYKAIMEKLENATDVVALLTARSVGRPWILYEAGVAKGKLAANAPVFGIAFGIALGDATVGPFAQFQNSPDDEDAITSVVLQLIRRNPQANPREQAVRLQVQAFRASVATLLKNTKDEPSQQPARADENTVAKFFEEIKVLVSTVPERVRDGLGGEAGTFGTRKRRRFHPMMVEELLHHPMLHESGSALPLLVAMSMLSDQFPWLSEIGTQFYRAAEDGNLRAMERAYKSIRDSEELAHRGSFMREMIGGGMLDEAAFILHQVVKAAGRMTEERRHRQKSPVTKSEARSEAE